MTLVQGQSLRSIRNGNGGLNAVAATPHPTTFSNPTSLPTPYLRICLTSVLEAYRRTVAAFPEVRVHYAMKCNPDRAILAALHTAGCSFEIASAPELALLQDVGVAPQGVLFSNPVKPASHIAAAARAGVERFAIDSHAELGKVAAEAPGSKVYVRLATAGVSSQVASEGKFGVDSDCAFDLLVSAVEHGAQPYGLTFHVGSQMLDPCAWESAVARCGALMRRLDRHGVRLSMLDLGGGFPARYDVAVPPIEDYGHRILAAVERELPYSVDLVIEPGRSLVAEAGVMVAEVIGTAVRHGQRWVHLDVGAFNGMMEALETGNGLRFPVRDSRGELRCDRFHLTGPSCDSQDTILFDVELSASIRAGDLVYIGSAGAYTTSYASNFNGFDVPLTLAA